jgi:hypothetical protein
MENNQGGEIMPDYIFRRTFKRKALDRWENEGGMICADETGIIKSGSPDNRAGKDNAAQISKSSTAETLEREKKQRR